MQYYQTDIKRHSFSLTFDLGYELAGSGEDLHGVEQGVGVDDLTEHPQDLPQTLVSHGTLALPTWIRQKDGGRCDAVG